MTLGRPTTRGPLLFAVLAALATGCPETPSPPALPPLPPRVDATALGPPRAPRPLREATVAFTGEVRGEIEPCGCPTVPYGGFRRRANLLADLRAEGLPVFVLDAGDMLVKGLDALDVADRPARARAILDLARGVGLDAWAPGASDLVPGGLAVLNGTGAFSANWRTGDGRPPLAGATIVEREGFRLGVVGLSAPAKGLGAEDAVAAVTAAKQGEADAWVVLSNAPEDVAVRVAEGVPGIGAVLSTRGAEHDAPRETAGAPVIETPDRGRYVTVLRVALAAEPGPWEVVVGGVWKEVADVRARLPRLDDASRAAAAAKVEAARPRLAEATAGHDAVLVEDRPLGSDLDAESRVVDARIAAFKEGATAAARARVARAPEEAGYATAAPCVRCHERHFMAWTFSDHARAWESLVARKATENPECVACHSTGWGQPGGYADLTPAAAATWKAVQCEACHGPLAGHPSAGVKARPVTTATCVGCHDVANSPQFDADAYMAKVSCVALARAAREEAAVPGGGPTPQTPPATQPAPR